MGAFPGAGGTTMMSDPGARTRAGSPADHKGQRIVNKDVHGPLFGLKSTGHWGGGVGRTAPPLALLMRSRAEE